MKMILEHELFAISGERVESLTPSLLRSGLFIFEPSFEKSTNHSGFRGIMN
jgi:hypothetical protein